MFLQIVFGCSFTYIYPAACSFHLSLWWRTFSDSMDCLYKTTCAALQQQELSAVSLDMFMLWNIVENVFCTIMQRMYYCPSLLSVSFTHTLYGSKQQQLFWASLSVLAEIRVCSGVICSPARGAHFLVCGHWALAAVHQYGSLWSEEKL